MNPQFVTNDNITQIHPGSNKCVNIVFVHRISWFNNVSHSNTQDAYKMPTESPKRIGAKMISDNGNLFMLSPLV